MILRAGTHRFVFPRPALVMGVLNVTPDSFSDGGRYFDVETAVDHALRMEDQGADIIDVGGESTRPGARPVGAEEELRRVLPVLEKLAGRIKTPLSIDTRKVRVARAALESRACMVNDIGAARAEDGMIELVAASGAAYVIMHALAGPETMQLRPVYEDVVETVGDFFRAMTERMLKSGVKEEQLVLDVGIGFGKTSTHNLRLLGATRKFAALGRPLMLGVSRKSFMGTLLGLDVTARLPPSLACATLAVREGAKIIRTHDVAETKAAVRMTEAILEAGPGEGWNAGETVEE